MNKKRSPIPKSQKRRLLEKNGYSCCVCKSNNIGLHLHHIDENPSNNDDENIAVLCVREHDRHHRPSNYNEKANHLELTSDKISQNKKKWEAFITETKQDNPKILAVINAYGTKEHINTVRILFQWVDGRIEFQKDFNYMYEKIENIPDLIMDEVKRFGENIPISLIDQIDEIEHCKNNHGALSRIINENYAIKLTSQDWIQDAMCSLYINPKSASLAFTIFYKSDQIYSCSIHKCGNDFHIHDGNEIRVPFLRKRIRTQLTLLVNELIFDTWGINPENLLIGTGNHEKPNLIDKLILPKCWENDLR